VISIVTNIDNDHLGTHDGDFGRLKQSFIDFLHNLPFYGLAVLCLDDAEVRGILPRVSRPVVTYGQDAEADVRAVNIRRDGTRTHFDVLRPGREQALAIVLAVPGLHNVLNSLAAIAVATELGVPDSAIAKALANFQGIDRRLQVLGEFDCGTGEVTLVDDYGHHPTEVAATLEALRQGWAGRRLVLVFQPHRYTRTRDLLDDFAMVLSAADVLIVLEVYAAGEEPIAGADGRAICRAVRTRGRVEPIFVEHIDSLPDTLATCIKGGDLLVTMGAGSIGVLAPELPARLRSEARE